MSAQLAHRGVVILLEADPALVKTPRDMRPKHRALALANYSRQMRLRILPCKGGVRVVRGSKMSEVCATAADLSWTLWDLAVDFALRASEMLPYTATWQYTEDRAMFYARAAVLAHSDARILRLFGGTS